MRTPHLLGSAVLAIAALPSAVFAAFVPGNLVTLMMGLWRERRRVRDPGTAALPRRAQRRAARPPGRLGADPGDGAKLVAFVGHDTNLASLGGLLGVHWQAPGYAADDPPPGGALLSRLWRDRRGERFVELDVHAQPLAALRAGTAPDGPARPGQLRTPAMDNCPRLCPLARFQTLIAERLR